MSGTSECIGWMWFDCCTEKELCEHYSPYDQSNDEETYYTDVLSENKKLYDELIRSYQ